MNPIEYFLSLECTGADESAIIPVTAEVFAEVAQAAHDNGNKPRVYFIGGDGENPPFLTLCVDTA